MTDLAKYAGLKIKYLRTSAKFTQDELATKLGIGKSAISNYEAGYRMPKQDLLFSLSKLFNVSVDEFFPPNEDAEDNNQTSNILPIYNQLEKPRQQKVYNFASGQLAEQNTPADNNITQFPTVEEREDHPFISGRETAAGAPINGDDQDGNATITIDNRIDVPKDADELVTIAGDSMEPLIMKGDQVFIHWQPDYEYEGQIMIVSITDEGVTCKKVYQEDDKIRLVSINEAYDDMVFDCEDVRIIGKVLM